MSQTPKQSPDQANQVGSAGADSESFVKGLWGGRYQVNDVSQSVNFYTRQLGLRLDHQNQPAFAQVSVGNLKLILSGPGASGSRPMPDGRQQEPSGWNRVILQVDDLPARIEKLKKAAYSFEMKWRPVQVESKSSYRILTVIRSSCLSLRISLACE